MQSIDLTQIIFQKVSYCKFFSENKILLTCFVSTTRTIIEQFVKIPKHETMHDKIIAITDIFSLSSSQCWFDFAWYNNSCMYYYELLWTLSRQMNLLTLLRLQIFSLAFVIIVALIDSSSLVKQQNILFSSWLRTFYINIFRHYTLQLTLVRIRNN